MDKPWKDIFVTEYLSNGNNATQAYLKARPDVSNDTARANGSKLLASANIKQKIDRQSGKELEDMRYSKAQILANVDEIRKLSLKNKQLGISLKANKEIADLEGLYDRGIDERANYQTLIQSLVINNTTISSGTPPKQLESEVEAEFEDVDNDD